uniref:PIN domain-containing protein n=1 Tax=Plectus sambesii TaxID=2011161 RepID=A0A914WUK3_9BILA
MGKLRMQEEMRQLQKDAWVPVYLVPDLGVIVEKLHLLKQLAGAHKFVVVVQTSIIRTLDKMKKESAAVRESIRWLEMCLQQGNKYVRAQKETERVDLTDASDLPRETVDVLSCCASLSSKLSSGGATIATLITSQSPGSAPFRALQDAIRERGIYGVDISNVHQFNRRWMAHSKQHG